jgi:hypothetical protein
MNARHELQTSTNDTNAAFAAQVRQHLATMPPEEWERLRAFGNQRHRFVDRKDEPMPALTREELVEHCVSVDACTPEEILHPAYRAAALQIGEIEGRALFYVAGEGIFLWAQGERMTRMLWVTHPAYPPSW